MTTATGTEVDLWEAAFDSLSPEARAAFALEQVKTIRAVAAKDLSPAEFQQFMALAAKYDLDPLAHEIWGAKGKNKDGSPGKLLIMVGRDGLLKVARRDKTYAGFDADVVREKDVFKVKRTRHGREVIHEYEGSAKDRGNIVGAWAQVYVKGKHDVYFYAPWEEYCPPKYQSQDGKDLSYGDKKSSWYTNPSAMIQKCPLSLCLRLAYNLSGVYAEEEVARVLEDPPVTMAPGLPTLEAVLADVPGHLRDRLAAAYEDAQELRPGIVTLPAVQLSVRGQPPEEVEDYIGEVERDNELAWAARRDLTDDPEEAVVVPEENGSHVADAIVSGYEAPQPPEPIEGETPLDGWPAGESEG